MARPWMGASGKRCLRALRGGVAEEPCTDPGIAGEPRRGPKVSEWRYLWDGKRRYQRRDMLTYPRNCGLVPH
jgi:hypothetical protein